MLRSVIGGHNPPKYLSSDHDPLYRFHQWGANLSVLEVTEIKTVPFVPFSHPFVERLIGTIRREYLDRLLFWTAKRVPALLQRLSNPRWAGRTAARAGGWSCVTRCDRIVPLAPALSRLVPNSDSRLNFSISPCTRNAAPETMLECAPPMPIVDEIVALLNSQDHREGIALYCSDGGASEMPRFTLALTGVLAAW
jgi:hypothetical protein